MSIRLFFLITCIPFLATAQIVPDAGPVFDDQVVPRIDVLIAEEALDELLAEGNEFSNFEHEVTFIFNNGVLNDTIEQVGFRLRGNTSRLAEKKSFKLSFNAYVPGRKYHGLEKLNINGSHNDPTNARVKIAVDIARSAGLSVPRANHVELYINDDYFGLYTNVEHIDENFVDLRYGHDSGNLYKCLWPADLQYLGTNPENYKLESGDRRVYDLKTNTERDNYDHFARFVDVLNNTPLNDLPCELEKYFNVDRYLKAIAFEMLIGHWDNYIFNKNNFYLYHHLSSNQLEYIVFDIDNTLGINWLADNFNFTNRNIYNWSSPAESRPLYNRILDVQIYKDRLSYYLNEFMASTLHPDNVAAAAYAIRDQIAPFMQDDPLYPLDYGFTLDDFNTSFDNEVGYWFIPDGITSFVETRNNTALQQLQLNPIAPVITSVTNNHPLMGEELSFQAMVIDDGTVNEVLLHYQINGNNVITTAMFDDGQHQDGLAGDQLYGVQLPAINEAATIQYYIEALDNTGASGTSPFCDDHYLYLGGSELPLKINELMASNNTTIADEANEYDDWIELHNYGNEDIDLKGKFITDNTALPFKWPLPDICIKPGSYLLLWADRDEDQGASHTNFKLSAEGETLALIDDEANHFAQIDIVDYPTQNSDEAYARLPNGTGPWQTLDPSPGFTNNPNAVKEVSYGQLKIYPNPAHDQVLITLPKEGMVFTIHILNSNGQLVQSQKSNSDSTSFQAVDVSKLETGVYMIELISETGQPYIGKLIRL